MPFVANPFAFHDEDGDDRNVHLRCQAEWPDGEICRVAEKINCHHLGASEKTVAWNGDDVAVFNGFLDGEEMRHVVTHGHKFHMVAFQRQVAALLERFAFAAEYDAVYGFALLGEAMATQFEVPDVGTGHHKAAIFVQQLFEDFHIVHSDAELVAASGQQGELVDDDAAEYDHITASGLESTSSAEAVDAAEIAVYFTD